MPLYVYRSVATGCPYCRKGFEVLQGMHDEPLQRCPRCGAAVGKVPVGFHIARGNVLSNRNLREHGFAKLKRTEEGGYRREV